MVSPQVKREAVNAVRQAKDVSVRKACKLVGISTSVWGYTPKNRSDETEVCTRISSIALRRRRFGYRRIWVMLRREGLQINAKRVYRLYKKAGLAVKIRKRKRVACEQRQPLALPKAANQVWSMDFVQRIGKTNAIFLSFC